MHKVEGYWLKNGTVLAGRYRVGDVLGEGGMGIVYLGYDMVLDVKVSIKEYFPRSYSSRAQGEEEIQSYKGDSQLLYQRGLDKFINEARMLAKFEDIDSIVMVKDFFYGNGTAYIIMEHIEGENIKELVTKKGRMEPAEVLGLMKPILESLSVLHKEGLLHRDISPDNIVMRKNGKGVLIDFGAARFSENQENKTMTVLFKRGYSAQELYEEHSMKGAYTDVYGACATMYFMLTGTRPEESIRRLLRDNIVPLTKFRNINLPISAKRAVMKGMSVQPSKRYANMELLCRDLYGKTGSSSKKKIGVSVVLSVFLLMGIGIYGDLPEHFSASVHKDDGAAVASTPDVVLTESPSALPISNQSTPEPTAIVYEKVPNVVGKKVKSAKKLLKEKLSSPTIVVKKKYSEQEASGKVMRQSVKAGKEVEKGTKVTITLTVSKGKKPVQTKATAAPTDRPVKKQTPKPEKKKDDFAGTLPW